MSLLIAKENFQQVWHSLFHIKTSLKPIKELANSKELKWNVDKQELVLEALKGKHFNCSVLHLKKICRKLQPSDLHQLIYSSLRGLNDQNINDPLLAFTHLKSCLTLEQIEAALQSSSKPFENTLKSAKDLCSSAKYYLEVAHPPRLEPFINGILNKIIWTVETIIDTLLLTVGFNHLEKDVENSFDAQYRVQSILALVAMVSTLITLAIATTGSSALGISLVAIGITLSCVGVGLYFKYLKPAPRTIQGCQNLTTQASLGMFDNIKGREHEIDKIAEALLASRNKPKTHPLLIGQSGVGKTDIVKRFAKAVVDGKYPAFIGTQVYSLNAADLVKPMMLSAFESPISIEKILKRIQHRPDGVIIFIDEIHETAKKGVAERLKTCLDEGIDTFPYVIGATTDKEFNKYILHNNDPFARRFKQIPIFEMNKDETIAVLCHTIFRQKGLYVTPEAIEAIYDLSILHFPERPQPYMASKILGQAIAKIKNVTNSILQSELRKTEAVIQKLHSLRLLKNHSEFYFNDPSKNFEEQLTAAKNRLDELKQLIDKESAVQKIVQQLIDKLEESRLHLFKTAIEIEKNTKVSGKKLSSMLKDFALTGYYLNIALDETIQTLSKEGKGFSFQIDKDLILKIVEEEIKLRDEKNELLSSEETKNAPEIIEDDSDENEQALRRMKKIQRRQIRSFIGAN